MKKLFFSFATGLLLFACVSVPAQAVISQEVRMMGYFEQEFNKKSGHLHFSQLKLDEWFTTSAEEQKNLQNVIAILKHATNDNLATLKMQELGEKGLDVLIKIAKKVLL